jgi:hypothetical protein
MIAPYREERSLKVKGLIWKSFRNDYSEKKDLPIGDPIMGRHSRSRCSPGLTPRVISEVFSIGIKETRIGGRAMFSYEPSKYTAALRF